MSSLENALQIISLFGPERAVLRVNEVARDLQMPRSSVSRLLQSLAGSGLLERAGDGQGYMVGPLSLSLGSLYRNRFSTVDEADQAVAKLIARFGFTGYVSSLSGTEIVLLRVRQGTYPLRHVREVGTRLPAFETAMGLTLLVNLPQAECKQMYDSVARNNPDTPTWDSISSKLESVRNDGAIVAESLLNPGIITIATPFRHQFLEERVCIAIAYPERAADRQLEREIMDALLEAGSPTSGAGQ